MKSICLTLGTAGFAHGSIRCALLRYDFGLRIIISDANMEESTQLKTGGEKTMKAIVLEGPRQFVLKELPIPKPGHGELLVKIIAAPINPSDLAFIAGGYQSVKKLPTTPGFEGAGVVIESGGGVMGWSMVGKNVAVSVQKGSTGTYGQYAIVDSMTCMTLPNVYFSVNIGNIFGAGIHEFCESTHSSGYAG